MSQKNKKMNKPIFVVMGKSGCGKSEIVSRLCGATGICRIKTTTTRPKRSENDNEYRFEELPKFHDDAEKGRYIAIRQLSLLDFYGIDKHNLDKGGIIVADFKGFTELYGRDLNVVGIYIDADRNVRLERLKQRSDFDLEHFEQRALDDDAQFSLEEIKELSRLVPIYILENNDADLDGLLDKIGIIIQNYQ